MGANAASDATSDAFAPKRNPDHTTGQDTAPTTSASASALDSAPNSTHRSRRRNTSKTNGMPAKDSSSPSATLTNAASVAQKTAVDAELDVNAPQAKDESKLHPLSGSEDGHTPKRRRMLGSNQSSWLADAREAVADAFNWVRRSPHSQSTQVLGEVALDEIEEEILNESGDDNASSPRGLVSEMLSLDPVQVPEIKIEDVQDKSSTVDAPSPKSTRPRLSPRKRKAAAEYKSDDVDIGKLNIFPALHILTFDHL